MDEKRFTLRMDGMLFEEISEMASKHRRSVAKEIESAIAMYLRVIHDKELMMSYDRSNVSDEYARSYLIKLADNADKYKAFE